MSGCGQSGREERARSGLGRVGEGSDDARWAVRSAIPAGDSRAYPHPSRSPVLGRTGGSWPARSACHAEHDSHDHGRDPIGAGHSTISTRLAPLSPTPVRLVPSSRDHCDAATLRRCELAAGGRSHAHSLALHRRPVRVGHTGPGGPKHPTPTRAHARNVTRPPALITLLERACAAKPARATEPGTNTVPHPIAHVAVTDRAEAAVRSPGTVAERAAEGGAVGLDVADTAARVALLAVGRARVRAVGRFVAGLAAVVAEARGGLAVLGDVADCGLVVCFRVGMTYGYRICC